MEPTVDRDELPGHVAGQLGAQEDDDAGHLLRRADASQGDSNGNLLARRVAESLREQRKKRDLSLDQLAGLTGVSRAALSQIETRKTNPTIGVLWKIAVGLGIPFQSLLGTPNGKKTRVLRASDDVSLNSADGRMKSRLLTLAGASHDVDVYELRFSPKGILKSEAHAAETTRDQSPPSLVLCVSCVGRRIVLGQRTEEETEVVRETLGVIPTLAGFYSYGELSPANGSSECRLHNQTMTITTFAES